MAKQPLAEVFGFPIDNQGSEAKRCRDNALCPFGNVVPNCTKDKANDPLGVCSIYDGGNVVITCPIRFRERWIIAEDAAGFFFPKGTKWTTLTEVRLRDKHGKSAGNIDVVLCAYDARGKVIDFGASEIQAVYISGNVRNPFEHYMEDPRARAKMDWSKHPHYPGPDYLSSSRKRLAPQLLFKGGILNAWKKKVAVAINSGFFATLPMLKETDPDKADIAWFVYDLVKDAGKNVYSLQRTKVVYTKFFEAIDKITRSEPGNISEFIDVLQDKVDEKLENNNPPDTALISSPI
ncbi:MAG: hypothetical protein IT444_14160 [Phycisphaeraceae bacterium]|nr:hypothetical protein [Phycisphaeraceae bacterium]